jgi:hypothetical protein
LVGKLPLKQYREIKRVAQEYYPQLKQAWENAVCGSEFEKIKIRK